MTKRLLAFLCVLAVLCGGLLGCGVQDSGDGNTNDRFAVGYAKEDVNPWVYSENLGMGVDLSAITGDHSAYTAAMPAYNPVTQQTTIEQIIKIPMSGYSNSTSRLSTSIQEDNGDGCVGIGDGLLFTCTTVTDSQGYTLFMFTSDTISGYSNFRADLASGLDQKLDMAVSVDQVTLTGSHTHGGPDLNVLRSATAGADDTQNALWRAYYDYVVEKMVNAAVSAYNGRQQATMSKGSIDASTVTQENGKQYQLNFIRQYVTKQLTIKGEETGVEFISGSNLNTFTAAGTAINGYKYTKENIADADDTMYILQFAFDDPEAAPIILVNWRAHATMASSSSNLGLTSDYINSFRYAMEQAGYRMAFFQGAAGNIIPTSSAGTPWVTENNITNDLDEAIYYGGTLLAKVALECLAEDNMQVQTGNTIRATHVDMPTQLQTYSEGLIAAANAYKTKGHSGYHSKPYLHTDGQYYYITSKHHANAITSTGEARVLNLSAYLLGDGVAIVTSPNEMYDRYSLDVDTLAEARENSKKNNDWYDLETDTYGMPFVFGYTNGHSSYLGDYLSYSYNQDFVYPDTYGNGTVDGIYGIGIGSYETNTSRYARGTGEAVVAKYGEMLSSMTAESQD